VRLELAVLLDPRQDPRKETLMNPSGGRLVTAASNELRRIGGRYALCTMCIGVGQGLAVIVERLSEGVNRSDMPARAPTAPTRRCKCSQ
jgi:hypothetical protein